MKKNLVMQCSINKKVLVIGLSLITLLSGCGFIHNNKIEKAETLLQEKYNESFKVTEYHGTALFSKVYKVTAYSTEYPNLPFEVEVSVKENTISDTYAARRIAQNISDNLSENLLGVLNNYLIYTELMIPWIDSSPNMTINEYAKKTPENLLSVYVFITDKDTDNIGAIYDSLSNKFSLYQELGGVIYLYIVNDTTLNEISKYIVENVKTYADFDKLTDNYLIYSGRFADGKLNIDKEDFCAIVDYKTYKKK